MDTLLQYAALIGIGIVLGLEHALETDHVVAVTTLTCSYPTVADVGERDFRYSADIQLFIAPC
jgi:hypothetical protein